MLIIRQPLSEIWLERRRLQDLQHALLAGVPSTRLSARLSGADGAGGAAGGPGGAPRGGLSGEPRVPGPARALGGGGLG